MVLSFFLLRYLPITPRHRLPVINSPRIRKLALFPENAVRVFERGSGGKTPLREVNGREFVISEGFSQFQTWNTQKDGSPDLWKAKENQYL